MKRASKRAKLIAEALKIVQSSLNSHVPFTIKSKDARWHISTNKGYARLIEILHELY